MINVKKSFIVGLDFLILKVLESDHLKLFAYFLAINLFKKGLKSPTVGSLLSKKS